MRLFSIEGKLTALLAVSVAGGAALTAWLGYWIDSAWAAAAVGLLLALPAVAIVARTLTAPLMRLLRALQGSVVSLRDGDFSTSLTENRRDEFGDLVRAHNQLGRVLRDERQNLFQRELLLDTMVQNSPIALLLVDATGHVVYANLAARTLLNDGRSMNGFAFDAITADCPAPLRQALASGGDGLFSVAVEQEEETFHLSQRSFRLHGRSHRMYLIKRLTRELSRQEVKTWKKVIRIISHELNNSLAPITSLAHSGRTLARNGDDGRLGSVFDTIEDRARHLHRFIQSYAEFARLPQPQPEPIEWGGFLEQLERHYAYRLAAAPPDLPGWFDRAQLEQVLINLLKNAHEAGGDPAAIELEVGARGSDQRIHVRDRGSGMSEAVLASALLPFYSTKRSGSGLGLALAREIVEAHGGRIALANREGGGLSVSLTLPGPAAGAAARSR
jgi:nitrogen fixation/metabolism regulation signal transduction histidine kinase